MTIKGNNGVDLLSIEIGRGSKRVYTLMSEDYIILKFSLSQPAIFPIGSYVIIDGFGRFELTDLYQPKQNAKTGGWDYEIQFNAHYFKWKNKIFKYIPENGAAETSWSLTATLDVHLGIFLRNLVALGYDYNGVAYSFSIDASVNNTARLISYESANMLDALYQMADTFECEVWVTDSVINFGRCEAGDAVAFRQDQNVETMTAESNRATYATRLYAFGSDKNLPSNYRPSSSPVAVNGVVQKRLMLPQDTPYIDSSSNLAVEEAVEAVVIFDDIYPRTQSSIGEVSTVQYDEQDDDGNATGEKWDAYRFTLPGFTFSEDFILPDTDLQVVFQTGTLAGMTFNVKFNPDGEDESTQSGQVWEIIRNDDYGRPLPDSVLHPSSGDELIVTGWDGTAIDSLGLVASAEQELKQRAIEESAKLKIDPANYRCKMISATLFDAGGVWHPYSLGSRVTLYNAGCFESGKRSSRIIGYEYDLAQPYNSPIYVVGEKSTMSRISEVESKVESLTLAGQTYNGASGGGVYLIRTNDSTAPSDTNAYSALRTKRDFLSRTNADTALGKIAFMAGLDSNGKATFNVGTQFGQSFISGLIGGKIDADANGELESLRLRSWLEVPELRFNRATVLLGDQWQAPGGGIIESVELDTDADGNILRTGTVTLKLEDGEIGAVAVDDICKGYFHDFKNTANNATEDAIAEDETIGNTQFAGFCTVFFRITEIVSTDGSNKTFKYMLRPESDNWPHSFHPYQAMHFVSYGSFTNAERQNSAYQTRTYTRYLKGVDDWEFKAHNVMMQLGDLSNLSILGYDLDGYSAFLQNIYMTGTIANVKVVTPAVIEIETSTGDTFIGDGETITLTATAKRGWETLTADAWSISRDSGDADADAAWNAAHTSFNGTITLSQSDIGATSYNASALFTLSATGEGWTASKTVAVRTLRLITTLTMRFVSEYGEYDTFVSYGDKVQFQAIVEDALRNDYTSEYNQWSIVRHNGDTDDDIASDNVWNVTRASITSSGAFSIEWSDQHDDLQAERATFIVTAQKGGEPGSTVTGILSI